MRVLPALVCFWGGVTRGAVKEAHGRVKTLLRGRFHPTTNCRRCHIGGIVSSL